MPTGDFLSESGRTPNEQKKPRNVVTGCVFLRSSVPCVTSAPCFCQKGYKTLAEPFAITEKQAEYQQEEKDKKTYDKGKALIEGFMAKHNKKFEGK